MRILRLLLFVAALACVAVPLSSARTRDLPGDVTLEAQGPGGTQYDYDNGGLDCVPEPNSVFPIGQTGVDCNADGTPEFTVTVVDTTPPVVTPPTDVAVETQDPAGRSVPYSDGTAQDIVDGALAAPCDRPASFPVGQTTVTCSATDSHTNLGSATFTVTVTLVDNTPPVVTVPSDISVDTENPAGTQVSFDASANDNLDGAIAANCDHASGATFPIGPTVVTCGAQDSHGNPATSKQFTITVNLVDHTAPVFSNIPAAIRREADSAAGSIVNYVKPLAVDGLDGPIPVVNCAPASATRFPLGATTVNCDATDAHGNVGQASFTVTIVDTTPPVLIVPGDTAVYAVTEAGAPASSKGIAAFLNTASARDSVDPAPRLTNTAPSFFAVGTTTVLWDAVDASGNHTTETATLTVLPFTGTPQELPPPPDRIPPDDVGSLAAAPGANSVRLNWTRPKAADFDHVVVTRSTTDSSAEPQVVYQGAATSFADTSVQNGVEYRYVVVAYDHAGNRSVGVAVVAVPQTSSLLSPKGGGHVKKSVTFRWRGVAGTKYYNLQLFRGGERVLAAGTAVKVLSAWPVRTTFVLKRRWKYAGKRYTLARGLYTWYVWPGIGLRSAGEYGPLIGSSTFQVVG